MVRAILAKQKHQTRRVAPVEHLSIREIGGGVCWEAKFSKPVRSRVSGGMAVGTYSGGPFTPEQVASIVASDFCPYGVRGDRLWVRETWRHTASSVEEARAITEDIASGTAVDYRATYIEQCMRELGFSREDAEVADSFEVWRPSIHMPRWASRITLEVVDVRIERLQDISEEDARAEGVRLNSTTHWETEARDAYRILWNEINLTPNPIVAKDASGKKVVVAYECFPWSMEDFEAAHPGVAKAGVFRGAPITITANPWVWVLEFKKV